MRALLLRLSALDADAEGAVRVIAVFDQLVRRHAGLDTLVSATAQLAECPVGLSDASGRPVRRGPDGGRLGGGRPESARVTTAAASFAGSPHCRPFMPDHASMVDVVRSA